MDIAASNVIVNKTKIWATVKLKHSHLMILVKSFYTKFV